jgi:carbamoyltransferase
MKVILFVAEVESVSDTPVVVGINRTQDGSVSVMKGASGVYSLQKERITRKKHHWGRLGDVPNLYMGRLPWLDEPVDLVVECYSSDSEVEKEQAYHQELKETLAFRGQPRIERVSHHLAHLYSAFYPSPFEQAAVMVIDCQGSPVKHFTEAWSGATSANPELLEVSSFYRCERGHDGTAGRVECISKQLWDGDWSRPVGLGCFYYQLTRMIFPGEGNEGKVMGMAPFGNPDALSLPPLIVEGERVFIPDAWIELFKERDRFKFKGGTGTFEDCANLAAAGQQAFEDALLQVADWLYRQTGLTSLCFAGGIALNCSANGRLRRESPFTGGVFIPPSPHDGGTALGSAMYGLVALLGVQSEFRWENDFLGPEPDACALERAVPTLPDDLIVERPDNPVDSIVELLDSGRVVGLYQGRSESGPRALGNRTILADPRHPNMQAFINQRVKGREWFRPLAPIVLEEAAGRYFDIKGAAPFMQFASDVRPQYRSQLPAITHVDGTARLQTVEATNTPFLYDLLKAYEARTGYPILLNTSLNGPGQPLVESPQDAIECLRTTDMHALAMPPYLIHKRKEPDLPERS